MNNTIIFLSLIIFFLSLMLVFKIKIEFDMYGNFIKIKIYLFKFKFLEILISLIGLYIQINNSKKLKTLKFVLDKEQEYLLVQIKKSILDKLYFDDIQFKSNVGLNNASNTTIFVSILNLICFNLSNKLILSHKDTRLYYYNEANFISKIFKFNIEIKVYFTIFDLVFAIILSFYKRGKYVKKSRVKYR